MNLPDITQEVRNWFGEQARGRNSEVHTLRASAIRDPCDRCLYHTVHDWEKAKPIDDSTLGSSSLEITLKNWASR